jgi:hypothetical protein
MPKLFAKISQKLSISFAVELCLTLTTKLTYTTLTLTPGCWPLAQCFLQDINWFLYPVFRYLSHKGDQWTETNDWFSVSSYLINLSSSSCFEFLHLVLALLLLAQNSWMTRTCHESHSKPMWSNNWSVQSLTKVESILKEVTWCDWRYLNISKFYETVI